MKRLKYSMLTLLLIMLFSFTALSSYAPRFVDEPEVRAENPVGLRVKAVMETDVLDKENTVEYGLLVTRKVFLTAKGLSAEDFTLDCGAKYTKGVSKGNVDGEDVDIFFDRNDTEVYFACYIHGIEPYYYTDDLVVRPYAIFDDGVKYGDSLETSLYDTAKRICGDEEVFGSLSQEQKSVVSSIVADSQFTVKFYSQGSVYNRLRVKSTDKIIVPENPTKEGYTFMGWSEAEGGAVVDLDTVEINSDKNFYAVFEENIVYFNVNFWLDGELFESHEVAKGNTVNAPSNPELGDRMLFFGWSLYDENDPEKAVEVSEIIIENHTEFYAVLVENPNSKEFMEKLNRGYTQLKKIRETGVKKKILNYIKECIGLVLEDAKRGIFVDKKYVEKTYEYYVEGAKNVYNNEMDDDQKSQFANIILDEKNIDPEVRNFLADYFDIDISGYINKE